jgi:hypothetical protein
MHICLFTFAGQCRKYTAMENKPLVLMVFDLKATLAE